MKRLLLLTLASSTLVLACRDDTTTPADDDDGSTGQGASAGQGAGGPGGAGGGAGGAGSGGFNTGGDAVVVSEGEPGKLLLQGTIVTPDDAFAGEVLVEDDLISCVAPSCSDEPGAANASIVATNGIVMPGMIDTHNHILFAIFDESDWSPSQAYQNHNQWPNEARYGAMIDTKQYLNGEGSSPVELNCELNKYGELKGLIAGTTSILGAANPANKTCYRTVARTIDQRANGLCGTDPPQSCPDLIQAHTLFPSSSSANGVCTNFGDGDTNRYVVHLGEGVDQSSRDELADLTAATTPAGCLIDDRTTVIHGTAFGDAELTILGNAGMELVWSPRSNVFLYGTGTDLSKTTDIPLVQSKGITVSLAPDWSLGGSQNLLEELVVGEQVGDDDQWGDTLDAKALVQMVTSSAAEVLSLGDQIGSLAVGMKADIMVFGGDPAQPYASLFGKTPADVRLVLVDGRVMYGDDQLESIAPASPGCEALDVCGSAKFLCIAIDGGDASNKFGQTYADIESALSTEIEAYDAMDLSQWDFAPLAPLTKCP